MTRLSVSHRRYNPLLDEWVLCSPQRLERPWQGQTEAPTASGLPAYDASCYLCPGNRRANGAVNPAYAQTFVFDNDFPSLSPTLGRVDPGDELLKAAPAAGVCRVVCFSPRHDLTLAEMPQAGVRAVVDTWAEETARLESQGLGYVQVFENKGAMMGCSNPHPHGQIWATTHVPTSATRRDASQAAYLERHGRDLLGDYLQRERREQERVVDANEHWTLLVPFWAVWPFETLLLPTRHVQTLPSLDDVERAALAEILLGLNARYDGLFGTSFPYSMSWHGRPNDGAAHAGWRLHAAWFPPLLRSASVRKFVVGYELAAEAQRDLTPEQAAERLRVLPSQRTGGASPQAAQ